MWPFTSSPSQPAAASTPTPPAAAPSLDSADKCPVDHETRAAWLQANPGRGSPFAPAPPSTDDGGSRTGGGVAQASAAFVKTASGTTQDSEDGPSAGPSDAAAAGPSSRRRLSTDRVISSIPRQYRSDGPSPAPVPSSPTTTSASPTSVPDPATESNWVYPSELQFFEAMLRKNHKPRAEDMATIVPIHNAVNERAWAELLAWERGQGGDKCGGVKLISFKGRPRDRTPKAWLNTALGYSAPFDRHDWVISRCGQEIRYVIDFYTGRAGAAAAASAGGASGLPPKDAGNLSFYLDVRPALDGWEGARMRLGRMFGI